MSKEPIVVDLSALDQDWLDKHEMRNASKLEEIRKRNRDKAEKARKGK